MKSIEELLRNLARPEVLEFGLVTNRLPSVNIGGKFEPVDDEAPSTDWVLEMLIAVGGSAYVETLTDKPVQWTTRLDGVGVIAVAAIMRKDVVQARFTVARRDLASAPRQSVSTAPRSSTPSVATASAAPKLPKASSEDDEQGDDDPTVQTLLPPVKRPPEQTAPPEHARADSANAKTDRPPVVEEDISKPRPGVMGRVLTPTAVDLEVVRARASQPAPRPHAPEVAPAPAVTPAPAPAPPAPVPAAPPLAAPRGLDALLQAASALRASDLHLVAGRPLLVRVASDLLPRTGVVSAEEVERISHEIVPDRLRAALTKEGSCKFALEHPKHGRYRVSVARHRAGYGISLRVVPAEPGTPASLGLPESLAVAAKLNQGLVIVTGPAGHGKTTTLAAMVDVINRESSRHVVTIEDPIEIVHGRKRALVSQREVGAHVRSKVAALRAALREDADVIVVSELSEPEAVQLAVEASTGGRLVLATMPAPSAARAIERMLDMFAASDAIRARGVLAGALRFVVGQRLVPSADRTKLVPAVEVLPATVALYGLIREGKVQQIPALQQRAKALGVVRLDDALADLVRAKTVTLDVARHFAEFPTELEGLVGRPSMPSLAPAIPRKA